MSDHYTSEQLFTGRNFREHPLLKGEYDSCTFSGCVFAEADLSAITFSECTFDECDLSMVKVRGTVFRDAVFNRCKLLGVRFDHCNTFLISFRFTSCILNFASFYQLKIKQTTFTECKLQDADFTQADVSKGVFRECDLQRAVFDGANLSHADFRTAYQYHIDPEQTILTKARFSQNNLAGLLNKYKLDIT